MFDLNEVYKPEINEKVHLSIHQNDPVTRQIQIDCIYFLDKIAVNLMKSFKINRRNIKKEDISSSSRAVLITGTFLTTVFQLVRVPIADWI